jgi:exodeoxyribonuclease-1
MSGSFFFYDLETTGFSPRSERIMQFAGQRTSLDLKPIGEPVNILLKLTPDVVPSPDAIMLTGITPQQSLLEGVTEAEFLKTFQTEVVLPGTIFVGFNSIRFDDEFMRFTLYRNFYDPYEWEWQNNNSRWDILDMVRMTRALRPDGIVWPFASDGKPANRLELLTTVNRLEHTSAHDALSDVRATIAVADMIRTKQPELFTYLLGKRGKKDVAVIVETGEPFTYTSGNYSAEFLHTTAAVLLAKKNNRADEALVYDLRVDPTPFLSMTVDELETAWKFTRDPEAVRLPIKTIKYNRCPAVAPLGVMMKEDETRQRLSIDLKTIEQNLQTLRNNQVAFAKKMLQVVERMDTAREREQTQLATDETTVDERLYDGFIPASDKTIMAKVHDTVAAELSELAGHFHDERFNTLLSLYKARNFPQALTDEERSAWDDFVQRRLLAGDTNSRLHKYFSRLEELAATKLTKNQTYLLEELQLYGQSLLP